MNRIKKILSGKEKIFVGFLPLNYPSKKLMIEALIQLEEGGVDIIEIGFGGGNPYMDGSIIKEAYKSTKITAVDEVINTVKIIRNLSEIPIIMMTYKAEIIDKGSYFFEALREVGVDGILVPDMDYYELKSKVYNNLEVIPIINSNNYSKSFLSGLDNELFLYCISRDGKTGSGIINFDLLYKNIGNIGKVYKGKKLIGFAMGSKENILKVKSFADGIIIGSEIVRQLNEEQLRQRELFKIIKSYSDAIKI